MENQTTVLQVAGLHWATSQSVVENVLSQRPGVLAVRANAVAQTATVTYDPSRTSVADLAGWVRDCGYHCAGQSVPDHVCDPMDETQGGHHGRHTVVDEHAGHHPAPVRPPAGHPPAADEHAGHGAAMSRHGDHGGPSAQEMMGHGGHHGAGSMADMVRDMPERVRKVHRSNAAVRKAG